jgi:hypothetical protein
MAKAAKANKKTKPKRETRAIRATRIAKMFNFNRPSNPRPVATRFSKTNQPKRKPGRPPGAENLFTRRSRRRQ